MTAICHVLTRFLSALIIASLALAPLASSANARFISPDTLDPIVQGVGTNRYAYSGNDPINNSDPNGHIWGAIGVAVGAIAGWFGSAKPANAPADRSQEKHMSEGRSLTNTVTAAAGATGGFGLLGWMRSAFDKRNELTSETAGAEQRVGIADNGAATNNWNPTTGAGPLGKDIAETFRSATYTEKVTTETTTLYRAYGGKAGELGGYWTRTPPRGALQSTIDSALDQNWGNNASNVAKIRVPSGTRIYEGVAAAQRGLVGGGNQVFIQKVDPAWLIK